MGGGGFVEGGGSAHGERVDAGEFGGDLLRCGWADAQEEGKGFGGFGVGEHEAYADGHFALDKSPLFQASMRITEHLVRSHSDRAQPLLD
jgi:hypothetical protein